VQPFAEEPFEFGDEATGAFHVGKVTAIWDDSK
jgi:hypothetical protein